jgi:hypothetical protein
VLQATGKIDKIEAGVQFMACALLQAADKDLQSGG